jgi:polysaccharide pyruvyl transferase WcaK-like protein
MHIEIQNVGFLNKGAELMLLAILERTKAYYPDAKYVMAPTANDGPCPYAKRAALGFYQKAWKWRLGIQWGDWAALAPPRLRESYGLILDRDVDVVIDAAGFRYSDQWGVTGTQELARSARKWKRNGTKLILMPQAFGPFTGSRIRRYITQAIDSADLVMPRESISYRHLVSVVGEREHIKQFPDFTNLVQGVLPNDFETKRHKVCLVPNYRMIDKTDSYLGSAYLPFMVRCARYLVEIGAKPFVLVHEGIEDEWLARRISESAGAIPVIKEDDPLRIKGILGACHATLGSRYHGLVSALSQGTPALATGWSHKYSELLREYTIPSGVLSVDDSESTLKQKIDALIDPEKNRKLRASLLERSAGMKLASEQMWKEVFNAIDA